MNDQLLMGRLHRAAHIDDQLDPAATAQVLPGDETIDGLAADPLHDEVLDAVLGDPAVVQSRDVWVLQPRQNTPFLGETRGASRVAGLTKDLERDLAFEAVLGPLRQEDRAHAALAQALEQPVAADLLPRRGLEGTTTLPFQPLPRRGSARGQVVAGLQCRRQQLLDLGAQRRIAAARLDQPVLPLGFALFERLGENPIDPTQPLEGLTRGGRRAAAALRCTLRAFRRFSTHEEGRWISSGGASRSRSRRSQPFARSQSRRTVRAETPRAAAVSSSVIPP